jgi:hypothetical protein
VAHVEGGYAADGKECNAWVFCGRASGCGDRLFGECWLKHSGAHSAIKQSGRGTPWWGCVQLKPSLPIATSGIQFTHSLNAPGFNPCAYKVISCFQSLLSNSTCAATPWTSGMILRSDKLAAAARVRARALKVGDVRVVESSLPIA